MWPWGHLAFAYLTYRGWTRFRNTGTVTGGAVLILAFGALAPDLVDKPLAWTLSVLPSGRSLAHSLLTAGILGIGMHTAITNRARRQVAFVWYFGFVGHIIADAIPGLLAGQAESIFFWNWPFGPHPEYTRDSSFVAHFVELIDQLRYLFSGEFGSVGWVGFELGFVACVAIIWVVDGTPGLGTLTRLLRRNLY